MISIITPVFNGVEFIRTNIESVQKLTVPFEHIIVDGGSTDGTLEIIQEYSTVKLLHQTEKTGMYGAIDLGFKQAYGEYICWVNCDDCVIPEGFKKMAEYAMINDLDFVCSDGIFNYVKENKIKKVKGTRFVKYFIQNGFFPFSQPSTIFKKVLYEKIDGLNFDQYKIIGDMDLFYRMSNLVNVKFGYIKTSTSVFLKHGNSLGDLNTDLSIIEREKSDITKTSFTNRVLLYFVRFLNI